jgi:hypothetical protein
VADGAASGTIVHVVRNEAKWLPFYFERSEFHERDMRTRIGGCTTTA